MKRRETPPPDFLTCPAFEEPPASMSEDASAMKKNPPKKPSKPSQSLGDRFRGMKAGKWILTVVVAVVLVATLPAGIAVVRAGIAGTSAKRSLERAQEKAKNFDISGAADDIDDARNSLSDARGFLQATGFWRDVPGIGTQLRALEDASAAGAETLDAAEDLLSVLSIVTDALETGADVSGSIGLGVAPTRSYNDLSKDEKRELLQKFAAALPRIRLARDKIDLALELWHRVPQDQVASPIRRILAPMAEFLPILQRTLAEAVPLLETAVPLAGYPDRMTYLVLLQNAEEIRPGGGFVGTIGRMTLDAGDLVEFDFTDVYNLDNPASYAWNEVPPAPIAKHLGVKAWYLRDANWSPDFPESAARILDFYTREYALDAGKPKVDAPNAVIALEPGLFKSLLLLTGPIVVDGKTFDSNNFFDTLEYEVEQGFLEQGIPLENRKDLIQKIGAAMVEKLRALPASRWPEIVDMITLALERKQVMMYAKNPSLLSILDARGWTARTKPTIGDYVQVVDANLAALKTDGKMDKNVLYTMDARNPSNITATVKLTYKNNVQRIDWRYTRYRSYTRVYVPEGSTLISSSGAMKDDLNKTGGRFVAGPVDVTKELGKTVFGAFWSIEPGRTGTLSFTYKLPPSVGEQIQNGEYRLDWPKQAGVDHAGLTVDLLLGKTLKSAVPPEEESKWGDQRYEYDTDSLQDRSFIIKVQ
ncbi:DUF4012 domain-containing protein [Patescibacteria group bacterium]|nr:DUF4012 domain-containing protein [Patescibacteria group bacterium]